jgi:hypothetical protein
MNCFSHPSTPAVACCKSCARGICAACSKDLQFAVVCSDACAQDATQARELAGRTRLMYGIGTQRRRIPTAVLIYGLISLMLLGLGLLPLILGRRPEWVLTGMGLMTALVAIVIYRRYRAFGIQT